MNNKLGLTGVITIFLVAFLSACEGGGGGGGASSAATSAGEGVGGSPITPVAPATYLIAPPSAATPGNLSGAIVGAWRQVCQPYLPGDGASDITYTISRQGADAVKMEGVAKDYKNTSCSGSGTVIATPVFVQKTAGTATVAGLTVLKLVDEGAAASAPPDSKSIVGIDKGQLRFGSATGTRDSDGFPTQFEKPTEAYNKL